MKIYTRTGDEGKTALFGGRRVGKDSARIEAYGTVDELNAFLGDACATVAHDELREHLTQIQHELFMLGADLATPVDSKNVNVQRIEAVHVQRLESLIDTLEEKLPPIRFFILPGGTVTASRLHICRTICRRTERLVVHLATVEDINEYDLQYINRLSDLLFVLARYANHLDGQQDVRWKQD
ncbi:MAG: cob(I)yrinic acid a,c-diamide adenosyltransferase [Bacteroidetes bacterium]|nr:cob(I)yrinic acid a,c-diamide adenosyltransferase [Bacteroidota bacterium]